MAETKKENGSINLLFFRSCKNWSILFLISRMLLIHLFLSGVVADRPSRSCKSSRDRPHSVGTTARARSRANEPEMNGQTQVGGGRRARREDEWTTRPDTAGGTRVKNSQDESLVHEARFPIGRADYPWSGSHFRFTGSKSRASHVLNRRDKRRGPLDRPYGSRCGAGGSIIDGMLDGESNQMGR